MQDQHHPHRAQRRRGQHGGLAHQEAQAVLDRLAHLAAGGAQVEHEGQEGGEGHEAEADQVAVVLLQDGQAEAALRLGLGAALPLGLASGLTACHC